MLYVNDTAAIPNFYNSSTEGNVWGNVMNGSVVITGSVASTGYPNLYIGTAGAGYPVNNSTDTQLYGNVVDWHPLISSASSCGTTLSTSTNLSANVSASSTNCFNITAANVTLDCKGFSITGNNASNTVGVYSTQLNTTVENCNILNFTYGIQFNPASNGTINNNNITGTQPSGYGIYLSGASSSYNTGNNNKVTATSAALDLASASVKFNNFTNSAFNSTGTFAVASAGSDNRFVNITANSTGASTTSAAFYINQLRNSIINSTAFSTSGSAILLQSGGSGSDNITNTNATSTSYYALEVDSSSNAIANSTFTSGAATVVSISAANSNAFTNNTFISTPLTQTLVSLGGTSSSNTFYWNNFTATSSYYVNDTNGSNFYNSTEGNNPAM